MAAQLLRGTSDSPARTGRAADLAADKLAWITAVAEVRQVSVDGLTRDVVRRLGRQLEPEFDETQHWAA